MRVVKWVLAAAWISVAAAGSLPAQQRPVAATVQAQPQVPRDIDAFRFGRSPAFTGDLEHWQYETFRVRWRVRNIPDAWVTFALNPDGTVERMTMAAVSPSTDFSFDWQDLLLLPVRERRP